MKSFSIYEALLFGWASYKKLAGFFIVLMLLVGFIFIPVIILSFFSDNFSIDITITLVTYMLFGGLLKIALKVTYDDKPKFDDLLITNVILKFCISSLIFYIPIVLIFLIPNLVLNQFPETIENLNKTGFIPFDELPILVIVSVIISIFLSCYFVVTFSFVGFFNIDKQMWTFPAFIASKALTKGVHLKILIFYLILFLFNILGVLLLGFGLFLTIPVSLVSFAHVYKELSLKSMYSDTGNELTNSQQN